MEFKEYALIDCLSELIDYRGKTPKKLGGDWSKDGKYRAISAKNIKNNELVNEQSIKKVDDEIYKKWMKKEISKGDILLTSEAPLGETYYWDSEEKIVLSQRVYGLRANTEILTSKYLYAYMQSKEFLHELSSRESGTTVTGIRQSELGKVKIKVPVPSIQSYIGRITYDLNKKIQLNKDIIRNLELISQVLFKQWFIDFEFPNEEGKPYKSSGGEMVQSELGNIPKNWTFSYFSNYVKHTIGGDWGKENVEKNYVEQVSIIRGADIPELIKGTDNKVPTRFILKKNYENKKLLPGDIVIEISGGSPTQSTGRSIFINKNIISRYNDKVLCTNFCRIIRPVDFNKGIWLQMYINYLYKKNVFFNFENGTTGIKNLDLNAVLNKYKIISPSEDTIHLFSERMRVILDSIQSLGMENKRLANLRDTLLPKLLSGEIEIPDELEV